MTRDEDQGVGGAHWAGDRDQMVCPVCSQTIGGDENVIEAHVDTCLAHQASTEENEAGQGDAWEDIVVDGEMRLRMADSDSFRSEFRLLDVLWYYPSLRRNGISRPGW